MLLACSLPEAANAAGVGCWLLRRLGCGGLFAAGGGKCGMGITKRPLRDSAAAFGYHFYCFVSTLRTSPVK